MSHHCSLIHIEYCQRSQPLRPTARIECALLLVGPQKQKQLILAHSSLLPKTNPTKMKALLLRLRIQTILLFAFILNDQGIINGENWGEESIARGLTKNNGENWGEELQPQRQLITNGVRIDSGTYPFYTFNKFGKGGGCGASLIHQDILLSGAHCREVYQGRGAYVGAATNFGYDDGEFHEDDRIVIHPDFNPDTFHNDAMLIKLQTSSSLTPVPINRDPDMPVTGTLLTVMGFGDTSFNGELSPNLLQATVSVYDFDQCTQVYATESVVLDRDAQFCALDDTGLGADACQGDSGSPIIDERGVQMGIVSFGLGCGQVGIPATYTRISTYIDWIDEQVCLLSSNPPVRCRINTTFAAINDDDNDNDININNNTSDSSISHNDTTLDNFVETNATEAACDLGSDCSLRCDYAMKAIGTCFNTTTSKDDIGDGFEACLACTRFQNITSLLDSGELAPQDYMDQACLNMMTCVNYCGECFEAAIEFGLCAWDCDDGSFNSIFGIATPSESPFANVTNNVSTSTPSLFNNDTELEGSNSTASPSLESSSLPFISTTPEPTVSSNIFERSEPTVSPTTTSPTKAPTVTSTESVTFIFRGIKGPLNDEQIKSFEQGTTNFLQAAGGDTTVQVDYLYESSQTVPGDNQQELWLAVTTVVSSTRNDRPGVAAVDVVTRSQLSSLNYRKVLLQQDDVFLEISGIDARLTSDHNASATAEANNSNNKSNNDGGGIGNNTLWYAIGMLGLAVLMAVLVTIRFVKALRAGNDEDRDCYQGASGEAYFFDENEYVLNDEDAEEEGGSISDTFDDEFDPSPDDSVSEDVEADEGFTPETFDEEYDPSQDDAYGRHTDR